MAKEIIASKKRTTLDGNAAAAEALRQINPDVFGFYPITPTSYVGEKFSKFVADGLVETEYVCAESEHAAMSICVGATAAGARSVTATASQGLILMSEVLFNASGMRLPVVLISGNRSLGAPLSIHCDHGDAMAVRDAGWIQLFAENAQEAYDFLVCAFKIAEDLKVRTPLMMCMDCFHTTHTVMNVTLESDKEVREFVGEPILVNPLLDIKNPVSYGSFTKPDYYMEFRRGQLEGLQNSLEQTKKVFGEFSQKFNRGNSDLVEVFGSPNAKTAIVVMSSTAGTIRKLVDNSDGQIALVRPKIFRPFPSEEMRAALGKFERVLVLDRTSPIGSPFAPLATEVRGLEIPNVKVKSGIFGLGSRETSAEEFGEFVKDFEKLPSDEAFWINVRE